MTLTILLCQLLSGLGTAVMLTAVSKALPHLATSDARTGLRQAWPALTVAVVAMAAGAGMWIVADWATRRLNPQVGGGVRACRAWRCAGPAVPPDSGMGRTGRRRPSRAQSTTRSSGAGRSVHLLVRASSPRRSR
jgi:hypothetical protein